MTIFQIKRTLEIMLLKSHLIIASSFVLGGGLLREIAIARTFGISKELDIYVALSSIYLFLGTQIPTSIETSIISKHANMKETEIEDVILSSISFLTWCYIFIGIIIILFGKNIFKLLFNFKEETDIAIKILVFMIPSALFLANSVIIRSLLFIKDRQFIGIIIPGVISVSAAVSISMLGKFIGIYALPLGTLIGGIVSFFATYRKEIRSNRIKFFNLFLSHPRGFMALASAAVIIILGECVFQVGYTAERSIGSRLPQGSLSTYYYSLALLNVFLTVIISPNNVYLFPKIAKWYNNKERLFYRIRRIIIALFFIGCVSSVTIANFGHYILQIFLERGKFGSEETTLTFSALQILCYALPIMCCARTVSYTHLTLPTN